MTALTALITVTGAVAPAGASMSSIGKFEVLGGHFRQKVDYLASYQTTPSSESGCWTYQLNDQGGSTFDLSFDELRSTTLRFREAGFISASPPLKMSGTSSHRFSQAVEKQPGPNFDSDCKPAATVFPNDLSGCGTVKPMRAESGLSFVSMKKGAISAQGDDLGLFGLPLTPDPLTPPCPSDSLYANFPVPAASEAGLDFLDDAKPGTKVTLKGSGTVNGKGPVGFAVPFEWVAGSQRAELSWKLKLQRAKRKH